MLNDVLIDLLNSAWSSWLKSLLTINHNKKHESSLENAKFVSLEMFSASLPLVIAGDCMP